MNLDVLLQEDASGRPLRLFSEAIDDTRPGMKLVDAGTFHLDSEQKFTEFDAEQGGTMYLLHLRPAADLLSDVLVSAAPQPSETDINAEVVPLENHLVSHYDLPATNPRNATKDEQELVHAFTEFLSAHGHNLGRFKITTQGSICPLFSDLYDTTEAILYEVGQILDYRLFLSEGVRTSLLVPGEPQ